MADFSLGTNGTGHLTTSQNWNNSYQVSYHHRLWLTVSGAFSDGASWSGNAGGVTGSGGFSYGSGTTNLWEFDHTYNKDANGNLTINVAGSINGNNAPYVGSGGTNYNVSPARIGVGPGWASSVADQIAATTARLGNEISNYGTGTSVAMRMYYTQDGASEQHTSDQNDTAGYNYWTVTGLTPNAHYSYHAYQWNNNGDASSGSVQTFVTLANVTETSKDVQATTADFVLAATQGYQTTTAKVQYRKQGDTTWLDSSTGSGATPTVSVSDLLPNTTYEYRLVVTTTAGTTTGTTQTLTTLPAGKLIYSDGTVKNAIPRRVNADGTVTMLNISEINPA